MYEVYNNSLCVYANDLIRLNKRGVGSERGFLAEGTYNYKVNRGLLVLMRRASHGKPALIEYKTMEEDVKKRAEYRQNEHDNHPADAVFGVVIGIYYGDNDIFLYQKCTS